MTIIDHQPRESVKSLSGLMKNSIAIPATNSIGRLTLASLASSRGKIIKLCFVALFGSVLLSACESDKNEPEGSGITLTSNGVDTPPVNPPANNNNAAFTLQSEVKRFSLTEGDSINVILTLSRDEGHTLPVALTVATDSQNDAKNLLFSFDNTTLEDSTSQSTLTLELGIAMAPILPQQRSITVTASDSSTASSTTLLLDISPIAAPDVYLLAGQSNMEGFSENNAKNSAAGGLDEANPRIRQLNATGNDDSNFARTTDFSNPEKNVAFPRFVMAEDPLHRSFNPTTQSKEGTRIGLGLSFAKAALPNTSQDIILVPTAWAGTGFCDKTYRDLAWNPELTPGNPNQGGTQLFERALTRVNIALQETGGILRGILWHQGETDAIAECSSRYAENLKAMVNAFRTRIQPDARGPSARGVNAPVPFILGSMSRGDDERGEFSIFDEPKTEVDQVHRTITSLLDWSEFSNHDDLVPPAYSCGEGFCVHFGASAYREMGLRYYQALQAVIQR